MKTITFFSKYIIKKTNSLKFLISNEIMKQKWFLSDNYVKN